MIELFNDKLIFQFPDTHPEAICSIDFQRTLRIPDDNRAYALPPGLGLFPVKHVDDYSSKLPETWRVHGGVFIPMYQSEALWINFSGSYPCAVKIAAGKINAVSGKEWLSGLSSDPQDYVVVPDQPWLDGFNVSEGYIRQFVAMPLGEGYTAEEQITGMAEHGGLQIMVYPMKRDNYVAYCERPLKISDIGEFMECINLDLGLSPGGLMRQKIYEDEYGIDAWDMDNGLRCFVHLTNSAIYEVITGQKPHHNPISALEYSNAGLPWFDFYSDKSAIKGSGILKNLVSVATKVFQNTNAPMIDNDFIQPKLVNKLGKKTIVRDGKY